jgi:glucose-fructose oxidoreductase
MQAAKREGRMKVLKIKMCAIFALATIFSTVSAAAQENPPIRVALVGLVHGHAGGLLRALPQSKNAKLVAIVEPRTDIARQYATKFQLEEKLFYTDLEKALQEQHPDAVLVYTAIGDHKKIIEAAAKHGIHAMVEKPLSTTLEDAVAIRDAARKYHVHVLVNYETTWYASNREVYDQVAKGGFGDLRRIVVHDGHEGPKEIGVEPEFLEWLTDPIKNGAGALFDFGCYGADLATVLMHGQAPTSVSAVTQTEKPDIYPKVDDEATVILRYPKAQAVLMPSWNWPFSRKDMEVYGVTGYGITVGADKLRVRYAGEKAESMRSAHPVPKAEANSLDYLASVLRGQIKPDGDPSSLETNLVVMQILDAARRSAQTGKAVEVVKFPD